MVRGTSIAKREDLLAERTLDNLVLECPPDIEFQLKEGPGRECVTSAARRKKINPNDMEKQDSRRTESCRATL